MGDEFTRLLVEVENSPFIKVVEVLNYFACFCCGFIVSLLL